MIALVMVPFRTDWRTDERKNANYIVALKWRDEVKYRSTLNVYDLNKLRPKINIKTIYKLFFKAESKFVKKKKLLICALNLYVDHPAYRIGIFKFRINTKATLLESNIVFRSVLAIKSPIRVSPLISCHSSRYVRHWLMTSHVNIVF